MQECTGIYRGMAQVACYQPGKGHTVSPEQTIVAEALGYSAKTIESHASASGADYARYVGAIVGNE
jgi:hypothetical protein